MPIISQGRLSARARKRALKATFVKRRTERPDLQAVTATGSVISRHNKRPLLIDYDDVVRSHNWIEPATTQIGDSCRQLICSHTPNSCQSSLTAVAP